MMIGVKDCFVDLVIKEFFLVMEYVVIVYGKGVLFFDVMFC